jgi:two-component system LytT family sensor kinase
MSTPFSAKKISTLIGAGIWIILGVLILWVQPMAWGIKIPPAFFGKQLVHFVLLICLYYFNARIVVPRILFGNKSWIFILWIVAATAAALLLSELMNSVLHIHEAIAKASGHAFPKRPRGIDMFALMSTLLSLGVSTAVAAFDRWQQDALLRQELEKEKVKSELSFLKAQINPHFFFNTLNNIYSLSFIDVPASQDALHKLSRMMRYLLYETQYDTTLLSKEISFIKDYIQLMKLRLQEDTKISFTEPGTHTDMQIAPMVLLPYIENAFKHGISANGENEINVNITFSNNQLSMFVSNRVHRKNHIEQQLQEYSGIGLQNTLRRLDLIYPGKHELKINDEGAGGIYSVQLKIELS